MTRYVRLLPPVLVRDVDRTPVLRTAPGSDDDRQPVTLTQFQFIAGRLRDLVFGQSMATVEAMDRIRNAISALPRDAQTLELDEAAWRLLAHAVRTPHPRTTYEPIFALNALEFMRAITEATTEPPTQKADENEAGAPAN